MPCARLNCAEEIVYNPAGYGSFREQGKRIEQSDGIFNALAEKLTWIYLFENRIYPHSVSLSPPFSPPFPQLA